VLRTPHLILLDLITRKFYFTYLEILSILGLRHKFYGQSRRNVGLNPTIVCDSVAQCDVLAYEISSSVGHLEGSIRFSVRNLPLPLTMCIYATSRGYT